jgi:transposase
MIEKSFRFLKKSKTINIRSLFLLNENEKEA